MFWKPAEILCYSYCYIMCAKMELIMCLLGRCQDENNLQLRAHVIFIFCHKVGSELHICTFFSLLHHFYFSSSFTYHLYVLFCFMSQFQPSNLDVATGNEGLVVQEVLPIVHIGSTLLCTRTLTEDDGRIPFQVFQLPATETAVIIKSNNPLVFVDGSKVVLGISCHYPLLPCHALPFLPLTSL